jgi:hypothetical protein
MQVYDIWSSIIMKKIVSENDLFGTMPISDSIKAYYWLIYFLHFTMSSYLYNKYNLFNAI